MGLLRAVENNLNIKVEIGKKSDMKRMIMHYINSGIKHSTMNLKTGLKPASTLILILILTIITSALSLGQVRLPRLVSDGMILQRGDNTKIWGWSGPNDVFTIRFTDNVYKVKADMKGNWSVRLTHLKAGGPYSMQIYSTDTITINNILIGDVWICSGQSNMELSVKRVSPLYQAEIASSENTFIRYFTVPQRYNFNEPEKDLPGGKWIEANPVTILDFSAVAYFFARELFDKFKVPVGLINASLGGSPAEAWISQESLITFPEYYAEAQKFKDNNLIKQIEGQDNARMRKWYSDLNCKDDGLKDLNGKWSNPGINTDDWAKMKIPGYWADGPAGPVNGVIWFKREVDVPASMTGVKASLDMGRIVDADSVFINGAFIGTTGYQYPPRRYIVPSGILKKGKNTIIVRVISNIGRGGFVPDKPYELRANDNKIDLKGEWQYRIGAVMDPLAGQTFIRWKPEGLYNAMISPLTSYRIKGAIWYQGESNTSRALEYQTLFPALIKDWRTKWNQGDFPFLYVQLPNFMEKKQDPSESSWAELREAQLKSLSLPNTAMAVAIDIGEWNDIHPLNKKEVGHRLCMAAESVAYDDKSVVSSGPLYKAMKVRGNKIILSFTNAGGGLTAKDDGELRYFSIAGADKKFAWAEAKIKNNKVVVWNSKILHPIAVRYAWADNPEGANLYNKEGLPASPFRTDD